MRGSLIAGRYRLEKQLAATAMSTVWTAEDLELGRPVVVKILAPDADAARFEREARAVAALAHPNVVRVFDFGESPEGRFMVLELLGGGSLEDRLEPGRPIADVETRRIALEVAAGLAHAHAAGLVHRDLKPANVLFDEEERPKIADFGIARIEGGGTLTEAGTVLGTATTISPEQAAGAVATPASDVYSFGVILYRMLAGRFPFEAEDPMTLAELHLRQTAPPLADLRPDVPARLESVAMACLAKNPAERPPDGSALLRELGGGGTDAATRIAAAAIPGDRRVSARALALGAAALAVAGAGAGAALLATRSTESPPAPAPAESKPVRPTTEDPAAPPPTTTAEEATTQATTAETATPMETAPLPTATPTETAPLPTVSTEVLTDTLPPLTTVGGLP